MSGRVVSNESRISQASSHLRTGSRTVSGASQLSSGSPRTNYMENELRRKEREEARAIREALDDIDSRHIYAAAQDKAAESVWRHQNCGSPLPSRAQRQLPHHNRTQSLRPSSRASGADVETHTQQVVRFPDQSSRPIAVAKSGGVGLGDGPAAHARPHALWDSAPKKAYLSLSMSTDPQSAADLPQQRAQKHRTASGNSSKGVFRNPEDHIYEEPDDAAYPSTAQDEATNISKTPLHSSRSPFVRRQRGQEAIPAQNFMKTSQDRGPQPARRLSRNERRTSNPWSGAPDADSDRENRSRPCSVEGAEGEGDTLHEATRKNGKHRRFAMPARTPPADGTDRSRANVKIDGRSERSGMDRVPSVGSAQRSSYEGSSLRHPRVETDSSSAAPLPVTKLRPASGKIPQIPAVPAINLPDDESASSHNRAMPIISEPEALIKPAAAEASQGRRRSPFDRAPRLSSPHSTVLPAVHLSRDSRRPTASCTQCQLPIAGRIVSAAGERFHPGCFLCFKCGEALECVAFYPEPESSRTDRLARIRARANGLRVEDADGQTAAEDGHDGLRFYCHLDFHELFSPRCRSCKTPIEGEVIVACGAEWHAGHFFCAECGDPFDANTPFVEKDGYAWCVNCHTNRYSTKCKKCRRPVTDHVVMALGAEWHVDCFSCVECAGPFNDGQYFLRDDVEGAVCIRCEERRLKA